MHGSNQIKNKNQESRQEISIKRYILDEIIDSLESIQNKREQHDHTMS